MCLSIYAGSKKDWLIIEKTEGYFFFLSFFFRRQLRMCWEKTVKYDNQRGPL